jgi:predicted alpha/beta-hydrolase family hydrolase
VRGTKDKAEMMLSGPRDGPCLVLAHGAGAPMDSPFMAAMAVALAARGVAAVRFEFAYMAARRDGGRRAPPAPIARLEEEYRAFLAGLSHPVAAIGGKSLGGRVASRIVDSLRENGRGPTLVCLGYPFHPPGNPETLRTAHLEALQAPALIVQGERDPFGNCAEVEALRLSPHVRLTWLRDGDHSFEPRKSSGISLQDNIDCAAEAVASFLAGLQSTV